MEAFSIKPRQVDESEFIIPADFVDRKTISFQAPVIVDTTAAMMYSAAAPVKTVKKKVPVKKTPYKTPTNQKLLEERTLIDRLPVFLPSN